METTNHQTYRDKNKYLKVDKYFLKKKRRNFTKPIKNRTNATCTGTLAKTEPPHAKSVVSN